jgi:hypothetical protein
VVSAGWRDAAGQHGGGVQARDHAHMAPWAHASGRDDDVPCFCITSRNLMITLDDGRIITWRLPRFSALCRLLRQSASTDMRTILADCWGRLRRRGRVAARRKVWTGELKNAAGA